MYDMYQVLIAYVQNSELEEQSIYQKVNLYVDVLFPIGYFASVHWLV